MCGRDAGSACGDEEEGLGGVAGGVWFESMTIREFERCAPNAHPKSAGLSLVLMFVDKSPDSDTQSFVLNRFFKGRIDAHNRSSVVLLLGYKPHPDRSECCNIIGSDTSLYFSCWSRIHLTMAIAATKVRCLTGCALSEGPMSTNGQEIQHD